MAITYPLSHPTSPGVESVTFKTSVSVGVKRNPFTYRTFTQEHTGQVWGASIKLPTMTREQAAAWQSWIIALNGQRGTFLLGDPMAQQPQGVAQGIPQTDGVTLSGTQEINTQGWAASTPTILAAGDYMQIGQRLYRVLFSEDSDGSGKATFTIFPRIRETLPNATQIITVRPKGLFRLATNVIDIYSLRDSRFFDFSFDAVEAI